jgi:hypothetical protein
MLSAIVQRCRQPERHGGSPEPDHLPRLQGFTPQQTVLGCGYIKVRFLEV